MFGLENQNASRYGCVELAFLLANSVSNLPIWRDIFVLMNTIIEKCPYEIDVLFDNGSYFKCCDCPT